ncbi:MAG TPA: CrcB family protein [Spirillospora sp.]
MLDEHAPDAEAADPDVPPRERDGIPRAPWTTLGAISAGGMIGALARYGIGEAFPHRPDAFAWATWGVNVTGCLLMGVLMVALTEVWTAHRLIRPFLGVGALGGFTTFSAYAVDAQRALEAGAAATGLLYLVSTPVAALGAVYAGAALTRIAARRLRRRA